jgi:preprotein translocase subunit SecE
MAKEVKKVKRGAKIAKFFKGVWYELKKVNWPTRKELLQHTAVVISAIALISFIVWIMDLGFGKMLELIIR